MSLVSKEDLNLQKFRKELRNTILIFFNRSDNILFDELHNECKRNFNISDDIFYTEIKKYTDAKQCIIFKDVETGKKILIVNKSWVMHKKNDGGFL